MIKKYSTVRDMKIYAMVTAILGCVLCAKHRMLYIYHPFHSRKNPVSGYYPYFGGEESETERGKLEEPRLYTSLYS